MNLLAQFNETLFKRMAAIFLAGGTVAVLEASASGGMNASMPIFTTLLYGAGKIVKDAYLEKKCAH